MTERDALALAVVLSPEDPLPRLVMADWLEEHGEELSATPLRSPGSLWLYVRGCFDREAYWEGAFPNADSRSVYLGTVFFQQKCQDRCQSSSPWILLRHLGRWRCLACAAQESVRRNPPPHMRSRM